jgi:hypothetical protein
MDILYVVAAIIIVVGLAFVVFPYQLRGWGLRVRHPIPWMRPMDEWWKDNITSTPVVPWMYRIMGVIWIAFGFFMILFFGSSPPKR